MRADSVKARGTYHGGARGRSRGRLRPLPLGLVATLSSSTARRLCARSSPRAGPFFRAHLSPCLPDAAKARSGEAR
eukprot:15432510-Alexandrium_andersonii.AAC.1